MLPILYSFRRCPYAIRARLALWCSGSRVELREVVLRDKPPELIAASPKATVPVLLLPDGSVIEQSLEIMLWALRQNDPQRWLDAGDATTSFSQIEFIQRFDREFKPLLDHYKYPERHVEFSAEEHRARAAQWLAQSLDPLLAHAPFLAGERPRLVDAAIAPFIRQYAAVDAAWFHVNAASINWLNAIVSDAGFIAVMDKYPQWQNGAAATYFGKSQSPA